MKSIIKKAGIIALSAAMSVTMLTAFKAPVATDNVAAATTSNYNYNVDAFNNYKAYAIDYLNNYVGNTRYASVRNIKNYAIYALNSMTYNPNKSLDANNRMVNQFMNTVLPLLDKQENVERFEEYKIQKMAEVVRLAGSNPTQAQSDLLRYTAYAMSYITYDSNKSYEDNLRPVDQLIAITTSNINRV